MKPQIPQTRAAHNCHCSHASHSPPPTHHAPRNTLNMLLAPCSLLLALLTLLVG
jgi:hypothetical protein